MPKSIKEQIFYYWYLFITDEFNASLMTKKILLAPDICADIDVKNNIYYWDLSLCFGCRHHIATNNVH